MDTNVSKAFQNKVASAISKVVNQREKVIHPIMIESIANTLKHRNTNYITYLLNEFVSVNKTLKLEQISTWFVQVANFNVAFDKDNNTFKVTMKKGFDYNVDYFNNCKSESNRYWKLSTDSVKLKKICKLDKVLNGVEIQLARALLLDSVDMVEIKQALFNSLTEIENLTKDAKVVNWCAEYETEQAELEVLEGLKIECAIEDEKKNIVKTKSLSTTTIADQLEKLDLVEA